ncbi:MAG: acyl-CoA/acyl-ACP dehydrogenase [Deltaproteobacteria bacterium]|nr:acyl-CoA/acyl-ACP dehydrogenase [Deltaproteobacteria bacterium]
MNYDLSQEQQMLKDAAHRFLVKECPSTFVRQMAEEESGHNPELWKKMADLGWTGLIFPSEYEGSEASFLDLAVLLYEMGYVCLPGPFLATMEGGLTVLEAGNDFQKKDYLPKVASGEKLMTLAWTEQEGSYAIATRAEFQDTHYLLTGTKLFVPDAHLADTLICVARTKQDGAEEIGLFLVDGKALGVKIKVLPTLSGEKLCEVTFDQVHIPKENRLGRPGQVGAVLDKIFHMAAVAKCAEMCGGAQRVIELVMVQAKERVQFGHPIGSFQAVQHHCANILTFADTSRFMTFQAAWKISQGLDFEKEAAMCKAWVSESHRRLVALAHQVMGGMGFMEEHDLQLYFKRAKTAELAFGDADFHREQVAQKMGL